MEHWLERGLTTRRPALAARADVTEVCYRPSPEAPRIDPLSRATDDAVLSALISITRRQVERRLLRVYSIVRRTTFIV